ncbi:hypothetical protein [Phenylobacterium sp.]|uniref:hypothetical protein n=1 Tax=Phenylobacterium sp. TaxID=1871053 RepID=UPI0037C6E4BD
MTLRGLTIALATAAALLGLGHSALAALLYPGWTINALWFVGTGLAMLIGAAANLIALGSAGGMSRGLIMIVNVAMTTFFVAAWPVLPEPQVIVGGVLFLALAACSVPRGVPPVRPNVSN